MYDKRRMKIRWSEKISNEEVLVRVGGKKMFLNSIFRRKTNCIGYILRIN